MHRLTFSQSLAELSQKQALDQWGLSLKIKRVGFRIGRELRPDEISQSGAYAIMSRQSNIALRVSLIKELAWLAEDESRYIAECWLLKDEP